METFLIYAFLNLEVTPPRFQYNFIDLVYSFWEFTALLYNIIIIINICH